MSRTRQIPAVDINMRDRALQRPQGQPQPQQPLRPMYTHPKRGGGLLNRLRTGGTQSLLVGGCSSMRDFCTNVQSITADLNNLLGSIESILPIVAAYLNTSQPKETISIPTAPTAPPAQTPPQAAPMPAAPVPPVQAQPTRPPVQAPTPRPETAFKQPRAEDIQQLLENPLVKNLLGSFVQNATNNKA